MKCYNHHDRDAFGICKACGKGLCLECMKKDSDTVLCKDSKCSTKISKCNMWSLLGMVLLIILLVLTIID